MEGQNHQKSLIDYQSEDEVMSGNDSPCLEITEEESSKEDKLEDIKENSKKKEATSKKQSTKEIRTMDDVTLNSSEKHEFLFSTTEEKCMLDQLHCFFQINQQTATLNSKIAAQNMKMVKYLAETSSNITKLMTETKSMVETLAKIEKNNEEGKRVHLRVLEVRNQHLNDTDQLEAKHLKRKIDDSEKRIIVTKNKRIKNRDEEPKAQRSLSAAAKKETRCHRCNRIGHYMRECPLIAHNKWFCYLCQAIKNHKGVDCPMFGNSNNREKGYNK